MTFPKIKKCKIFLHRKINILTGKPSTVQSVDGCHRCGDVGTLDVDIALGRGLVHVDVGHPPVLVALLDDVVPDLLVPVGVSLCDGVEHVGQHEALRRDGRQVALLLLLFGRHIDPLLWGLLDPV